MALITAEEAGRRIAQDIGSRNAREVAGFDKSLFKDIKSIKIFNVGNKKWEANLGSLGTWTIQPCPEGQEYSVCTEVPGVLFDGIPTDMKRIEQRPVSGKEVVADIIGVGPFKAANQDLTQYGVFVAEGDEPTTAEIKAARTKLEQNFIALVKEADDFFAQGPLELKNIGPQHREACRALKQDRDWARGAIAMVECPGCASPVNPAAAIHAGQHGCGAVINEAKVIAIKLKGYEHLWAEGSKKAK